MLLTLLQFFATKFLVLALHLEAGSFPKPLSAREEIETFAALRAGDRSAREKIIRHNLRLVAHVAKKYYAQPGDQEDLISIGTIGLMKAVDTFDTTRKARFATYASRCIENAILTRANAGLRIGTIRFRAGAAAFVILRVYGEGGPVISSSGEPKSTTCATLPSHTTLRTTVRMAARFCVTVMSSMLSWNTVSS